MVCGGGSRCCSLTVQHRVSHNAHGTPQEGLIALWRGWLPSVIGVIPYVGLNFAVYETLKEVVLRYHGM